MTVTGYDEAYPCATCGVCGLVWHVEGDCNDEAYERTWPDASSLTCPLCDLRASLPKAERANKDAVNIDAVRKDEWVRVRGSASSVPRLPEPSPQEET